MTLHHEVAATCYVYFSFGLSDKGKTEIRDSVCNLTPTPLWNRGYCI